MDAARELKNKIDSGRVTTGVLATFHLWGGLVEMVKQAGFDYLIADAEHGAFDHELIREVCALGRIAGLPVIVRVVSTEYSVVRKAVDLGPCGLMFPCVDDVAALDEARDAIYLPPRGKRRPGGAGNLWVTDYQYATWRHEVEDDFIVLPQIESRTGIGNAAAIARHGLTTAIAVGPYDLSADLGVCWQPDHPALREAISAIRTAGRAAGKEMWMIGDAAACRAMGFTFICIGEVTAMLAGAFADGIEAATGFAP